MKKSGQILILLIPVISLLLLVFFRESVQILPNIRDESFFYFLSLFFNILRPFYVYIFVILLISLYIFTTYRFTRDSETEKWWNYSILPSCFSLALVFFMVLISSDLFIRILFFLNTIFTYLYFRAIHGCINTHGEDSDYSLENLSSYGNFLAVYFFGASIYGLQSFLGVSILYLMAGFVFFIAMVVYQVIWANKITRRDSLVFLLLVSITLLQLAWSISFLTLSYYMLGLILAIFYYVLIGIVRFYLLGNLDRNIIKLYVIFGSLSMLSVLLTSTWL